MVMPRYQRAGARIAGVPQTNTAGLQEAARTGQTLAQQLDRVSNFAFRQAAEVAQEQGREYGALNAPTTQQIQDAIAAGKDPSELMPGDRTTAFGRAARGTAFETMALQFETQARQEIVNLQTQFENEEIDINQLGESLTSLVNEQTGVLRQVSPLAAQKFSAAVGTVSNAAYLTSAKKQAERDRNDYEIQVRAGLDTVIENAEYIVRAGPTVGEDGQIVTVDEKINALNDEIAMYAQELDDVELYNVKSSELREAYKEAQIGVVMDEALLKPAKAMRALYGDGKFEDPVTQATFDSMSNEQRRELFSRVNSALSDQQARENRQAQIDDRRRKEIESTIHGQFHYAMRRGDLDVAEEQLERAKNFDLNFYNDLDEVYTTNPGIDDAEIVAGLRRRSIDNALTRREVDKAYSSGFMSLDTYESFLNDLEMQDDKNYRAAMDWLKAERGHPPPTIVNPQGPQKAAMREVAQIQAELILEIDRNPDVDRLEFVQKKVREMVDDKGAAANAQVRFEAQQYIDQIRTHRLVPDDATAQEVLDLLNSNPNIEPNPATRENAIENLLPNYIQMERDMM